MERKRERVNNLCVINIEVEMEIMIVLCLDLEVKIVFMHHILKYKYNMNPLTVTWAPNIYTDWGWSNFQAWIHSGMDNYLMTPNGRTHRLLTD